MKHLRKFNELFDSVELKSSMEIDYISNNIPVKDLVKAASYGKSNSKAHFISHTTFQRIHYKLVSEFTFFNAALNEYNGSAVTDFAGYVNYRFVTSEYLVCLSIKEEVIKDKWNAVLTIKSSKATSSQYVVGFNNFQKDKMCCEFIRNADFKEIINMIRTNMVPLMKDLGFSDYLKYGVKLN